MAFKCTIELNKTDGISVELLDASSNFKQTFIFDGTTIETIVASEDASTTLTQKVDEFVLEVEADGKTSTMSQTSSTVRLECERFEVEADVIEMKSSKDTSVTADGELQLKSTKAFSVDSQADASVSSASNMSLKSQSNLTAEATMSATFAGKQSTAVGDSAASVKVEGLSVAVDASTTLTVKGGVSAQLQGATATVQGDASVAVRAPSVQLG